jgi:hypothetical protein
MNQRKQQRLQYLGVGLIVLAVFILLDLWWALPILVLGGVGSFLYVERRREGRIGAAVQSGLWLVGMAAIMLAGFWFILPGVLVLGGLSLLARGRERGIDQSVSRFLQRVGLHLPAPAGTQTTSAPITPAAPTVAQPPVPQQPQQQQSEQPDESYTGETTRL